MKFYGRESEIGTLAAIASQAEQSACFTVVTGRRRIGKTALILKALARARSLYLFVTRSSEAVLCAQFQRQAVETLGVPVFGNITRLADLFEVLFTFAETQPYTLVIDEFQDLERVNKAVFGEIQNLWDRHKDTAKINFIVCGSVLSMMKRLFEDDKEPLFGRLTAKIPLAPFRIRTLKEILKDHAPDYRPDDLLCLYLLTGGVAQYVGLLMNAGAVTRDGMLAFVTREGSPFLAEGRDLLISEFGRDYGVYFSILQLIAAGKNSQTEIDSVIGKNTGAYLARLDADYSLVEKNKPLFSKPESRNARWMIDDNLLRFWFRFIFPNQMLLETGKNALLLAQVKAQYEQYSGWMLEKYFRQKYAEEGAWTRVGSFWDRRGDNEIDLIALDEADKRAVVAEVKRNAKKIDKTVLRAKAKALENALSGRQIEFAALSLADM
jgi:AAA+ ATPase superfamily predicted ATPase